MQTSGEEGTRCETSSVGGSSRRRFVPSRLNDRSVVQEIVKQGLNAGGDGNAIVALGDAPRAAGRGPGDRRRFPRESSPTGDPTDAFVAAESKLIGVLELGRAGISVPPTIARRFTTPASTSRAV